MRYSFVMKSIRNREKVLYRNRCSLHGTSGGRVVLRERTSPGVCSIPSFSCLLFTLCMNWVIPLSFRKVAKCSLLWKDHSFFLWRWMPNSNKASTTVGEGAHNQPGDAALLCYSVCPVRATEEQRVCSGNKWQFHPHVRKYNPISCTHSRVVRIVLIPPI